MASLMLALTEPAGHKHIGATRSSVNWLRLQMFLKEHKTIICVPARLADQASSSSPEPAALTILMLCLPCYNRAGPHACTSRAAIMHRLLR